MNPLLLSTLANVGKGLLDAQSQDPNKYINYHGINIPVGQKSFGERYAPAFSGLLGSVTDYADANRVGNMYKGLGINMPEGMNFKNSDEVANYAKLATDIKKQSDLSEYRTDMLKNRSDLLDLKEKLGQMGSNDKNMTMKEVLDALSVVNPAEAQAYKSKYDFSMNPDGTQKNAALLGLQLPNSVGQQIINGTIPLNKARTGLVGAQTKNINTKTEYIPKEFAQKQAALQAKINIAKQKIAAGNSGAKQELQNLNIQLKKLQIEQNKKINSILDNGGAPPNVPNNSGYAF